MNKKYKFQKYRNATCRFKEIQIKVIQKYKIPNKEIKLAEMQIYK